MRRNHKFKEACPCLKLGLSKCMLGGGGHCAAEDRNFKRYNRKQYVSMSDL